MASSWIKRPLAFTQPQPFGVESLVETKVSLGADFWAGNVINRPDVVVANLDFAYIRCGQGVSPDSGYTKTRSIFAGQKPWGPYYVYDPRVSASAGYDFAMKQINSLEDLPLWIDCELTISGKSAANYWDDMSNLLGWLTRSLGYKPHIYTGMWWWQPQMQRPGYGVNNYPSWQSEFKFALAEYPYNTTVVSCSWETLKLSWLPQVRLPRLACGIQGSQVADWQFSGDKFILPGIVNGIGLPNKLDLNYVYDLNSILLNPALTLESLDTRLTSVEQKQKAHSW